MTVTKQYNEILYGVNHVDVTMPCVALIAIICVWYFWEHLGNVITMHQSLKEKFHNEYLVK